MDIEITARHIEVTDKVKDYARRKLEKMEPEFSQVQSIHVILDVQKYLHVAEIIVQARNHIRVEATEKSEDMYASIDVALDRIEKRLRKSVDKMQQHKQRLGIADLEERFEGEKAE